MIVDAENQVMGRLSSEVASLLLDGKEVKVINSEKAIKTGKPEDTVKKYLKKKSIGDPRHGPYSSLRPENILRDSIKGMLPTEKEIGRQALKRLVIVQGNSGEEGKAISKSAEDLTTNYITLEELSERIGGKQ
ncbi:MAG: uL13 family ribosomal protein [Candidatus Aenigmatarchaeota archaeon]